MKITVKPFLFYIFPLLLLSGCSVHYDTVTFDKVANRTVVPAIESGDQLKIKDLTNAIVALGSNIDRTEASWVAREAVLYPKHLANEYQLMWPPNYQNELVNQGLRTNGLCYQWARDMTAHIGVRKYKTLTMDRAVANQGGEYEHNVLTVAALGKGIKDAIILDPWRHNSVLYWIKTKNDPNYQWSKYYRRTYIVDKKGKKIIVPNPQNPANRALYN